jgi:competence protein ComEC
MRTAALIAFVAGVCGLQWQSTLPSTGVIGFVAAIAAVLLLAATRLPPSWLTHAMMLIGIASVGFAFAAAQAGLRMADQLAFDDEGRDVAIVGVVATLPARLERGMRFEFDVERIETPQVHVPSRILLGWYSGNLALQPGERWSFTVRLKRPHGTINPGGFDFEAWMLERNLRASGYVRAGHNDPPRTRMQSMIWRPGYAIERSRSWLRDRLQPSLESKRYGGVVAALVLGDQKAISDADWTLFNRTGIGHLVSISGLHITMIAGLAGLVVGALWRRSPVLMARAAAQTAAIVAGLVAAMSYALLAGWGVPAQRTVLMLATVGIAWLFHSRISAGTSLALAGALVCVFDPWAVLAPGFWLSFGAVAAIVWVVQGRPLGAASWSWHLLQAATRVQIAVTLALIPATVLLFHQLSIVSPFANAIAIPAVSWVVTPLALIGAAFAAMPLPLALIAEPILGLANAIFAVLASTLQWAASFSWATLPVATPPLLLVALAGIGVVWLLGPPGWPLRATGAIALIPMFVWPATRAAIGEVWVTALDVGQGSAVLIESADSVWLYDAGPRYSSDSDAGERIIVPYLRHRGIGRLDGVIVSHLDSDHSGGAASVLRSVTVERVVSSIAAGHATLGGRVDVQRCDAGMRWTSGALSFVVLHPAASDYDGKRASNAMSCVVRISLGALHLLLTGDIALADEAALLVREPGLRADWLEAPHHGSRTSSSAQLLDALGATAAVVQAGYRNRFRHPNEEVVARYRARNIELLRTDHLGAVQWRFAGKPAIVAAARRTDARYWHNRPDSSARAAAEPAPALDLELPDASSGPPEPLIGGFGS